MAITTSLLCLLRCNQCHEIRVPPVNYMSLNEKGSQEFCLFAIPSSFRLSLRVSKNFYPFCDIAEVKRRGRKKSGARVGVCAMVSWRVWLGLVTLLLLAVGSLFFDISSIICAFKAAPTETVCLYLYILCCDVVWCCAVYFFRWCCDWRS